MPVDDQLYKKWQSESHQPIIWRQLTKGHYRKILFRKNIVQAHNHTCEGSKTKMDGTSDSDGGADDV
jgi:hypothetical protein